MKQKQIIIISIVVAVVLIGVVAMFGGTKLFQSSLVPDTTDTTSTSGTLSSGETIMSSGITFSNTGITFTGTELTSNPYSGTLLTNSEIESVLLSTDEKSGIILRVNNYDAVKNEITFDIYAKVLSKNVNKFKTNIKYNPEVLSYADNSVSFEKDYVDTFIDYKSYIGPIKNSASEDIGNFVFIAKKSGSSIGYLPEKIGNIRFKVSKEKLPTNIEIIYADFNDMNNLLDGDSLKLDPKISSDLVNSLINVQDKILFGIIPQMPVPILVEQVTPNVVATTTTNTSVVQPSQPSQSQPGPAGPAGAMGAVGNLFVPKATPKITVTGSGSVATVAQTQNIKESLIPIESKRATTILTFVETKKCTPSQEFKDIANNWAKEYIEEARNECLTTGKAPGEFKPTANINRAEITKMALEAFGYNVNKQANTSPFKDVKSNLWYTPYVIAAKQNAVISGYNDGNFKPDGLVTRAEAIKIILTAAGITLDKYQPQSSLMFNDIKTGDWYTKYLVFGREMGIFTGFKTKIGKTEVTNIRPNENITRAEAIKDIVVVINSIK